VVWRPLYKKIFVDDQMALQEGRYTEDFLAEMQDEAGYDWMYRCLFPDAEEVLPNGYRRLVSDLVVDDAMRDRLPSGIPQRPRNQPDIA
jgi:hypothetical protein